MLPVATATESSGMTTNTRLPEAGQTGLSSPPMTEPSETTESRRERISSSSRSTAWSLSSWFSPVPRHFPQTFNSTVYFG